MERLLTELRDELHQLDLQAMRRTLRPLPTVGSAVRIADQTLVNLASNDYLGLSTHPHLTAAAIAATQKLGTGSGASRLVTGHLQLHEQVEQAFAAFKHPAGPTNSDHRHAGLLLPTGYMANLAVLTSLAQPGDLICLDKLNHASLIDAARATGAQVRTFNHLHYDKLARLLARPLEPTSTTGRPPRKFIVTDSIFSMDGDAADLPTICDLADEHEAIVIVDEAHGTGVLGKHGRGLCEAQGVTDRVHVVVSTASKALGSLGGIVTAPQPIIDTLINRARPLIYTTGIPPAQAAAIGAAVEVIEAEPWRRERVLELATRLRAELMSMGWQLPPTSQVTPILPLIVGSAERAIALAAHLQGRGLLAVAIRPPTVPPGSARVRLSLRADLEDAHIDQLCDALRAFE